MYAIIEIVSNRYRTKPDAKRVYTDDLKKARLFDTLDSAIAASCPGNEKPVNLYPYVR